MLAKGQVQLVEGLQSQCPSLARATQANCRHLGQEKPEMYRSRTVAGGPRGGIQIRGSGGGAACTSLNVTGERTHVRRASGKGPLGLGTPRGHWHNLLAH